MTVLKFLSCCFFACVPVLLLAESHEFFFFFFFFASFFVSLRCCRFARRLLCVPVVLTNRLFVSLSCVCVSVLLCVRACGAEAESLVACLSMPTSLNKYKIVKKRRRPFRRHQHDRKIAVKPSWRKPKGIDSVVRRQFRGQIHMPRIGYGSDRRTKHMLPNGFYKFTVHNAGELDMLLMHNRRYAAQIAASVGAKKRLDIVKRAAELDIKVLNRTAKMKSVEN